MIIKEVSLGVCAHEKCCLYIVLDSTALITEVDLYETGKNHICVSRCSKIKGLNYTYSLSQPHKSDKKAKTVALSVDSMDSS